MNFQGLTFRQLKPRNAQNLFAQHALAELFFACGSETLFCSCYLQIGANTARYSLQELSGEIKSETECSNGINLKRRTWHEEFATKVSSRSKEMMLRIVSLWNNNRSGLIRNNNDRLFLRQRRRDEKLAWSDERSICSDCFLSNL